MPIPFRPAVGSSHRGLGHPVIGASVAAKCEDEAHLLRAFTVDVEGC
jgi:hypothetical protein